MNTFAFEKAGRLCAAKCLMLHSMEVAAFSCNPGFHPVDMGVELYFENAVMGFTWALVDDEYGVECVIQPLEGYRTEGAIAYDVSADEPWSVLLGQRLISSRCHPQRGDGYPETIELIFEKGTSIFVAAAQYDPTKRRFLPRMDELVVFFKEEAIRRARILPFA